MRVGGGWADWLCTAIGSSEPCDTVFLDTRPRSVEGRKGEVMNEGTGHHYWLRLFVACS